METASGTPAAVRTWWYPGKRTGYDFIYPKEQASPGHGRQSARADDRRANDDNGTDQHRRPVAGSVGRTGNRRECQCRSHSGDAHRKHAGGANRLVVAIPSDAVDSGRRQRAGGDANSISADRVISERFRAPTRTQLPRTATQLPLVAMVGTLALLSAATLWYWRTRLR